MHQDFQTVLTSWEPKTSQRTGKGYWRLTFSGGQILQPLSVNIFEPAQAQKAMHLYNVDGITVRLEQNGQYTNLVDIAGPGEQLPPLTPQPGTPLGGAVSPPNALGALQMGLGSSAPLAGPQMPSQALGVDERLVRADAINERIARQEAQRTAAILIGPLLRNEGALASHGLSELETVEEIHIELSKRLYKAADPTPTTLEPQVAEPIQPTAETPAEVAAQVNDAAGANVVQQGALTEPTPSWA